MNILFRADSSSFIGTGHIMRDLVLVEQYKNDNVVFAVRDLDGNINHKIDVLGYKKTILDNNNFDELDNLIKKMSIDMIIIDHYGIDYKFEKKLKESNPKLIIFVLDDTYEKHYCDILLNHNIYADENKYKNLVPQNCELRCGSKYTLLRDEFIEAKKSKGNMKNKYFTFFIAMGGADILNLNSKILDVLSQFNDIKVHLITTESNRNLKSLKDICRNKEWIDLHINCNNMADLMTKSDFAIITPSVTANEVYFMGLPFIAIKVAENQNFMCEFLEENDFSFLTNFNHKKLISYIKGIWFE